MFSEIGVIWDRRNLRWPKETLTVELMKICNKWEWGDKYTPDVDTMLSLAKTFLEKSVDFTQRLKEDRRPIPKEKKTFRPILQRHLWLQRRKPNHTCTQPRISNWGSLTLLQLSWSFFFYFFSSPTKLAGCSTRGVGCIQLVQLLQQKVNPRMRPTEAEVIYCLSTYLNCALYI